VLLDHRPLQPWRVRRTPPPAGDQVLAVERPSLEEPHQLLQEPWVQVELVDDLRDLPLPRLDQGVPELAVDPTDVVPLAVALPRPVGPLKPLGAHSRPCRFERPLGRHRVVVEDEVDVRIPVDLSCGAGADEEHRLRLGVLDVRPRQVVDERLDPPHRVDVVVGRRHPRPALCSCA
jgi:hypothetical protein